VARKAKPQALKRVEFQLLVARVISCPSLFPIPLAFLILLAGQAAELVYGFDYGLLGYVVGNFYFADFSRQDKMHDSVASLFVGLEQA
jgi:hypothetical protein